MTPLSADLTGDDTRLSESTQGPHPFWLAECTCCKEFTLFEYGPLHELTRREAQARGESWCENHPTGCVPDAVAAENRRAARTAQWLDDARADAMFGQFDGDAA